MRLFFSVSKWENSRFFPDHHFSCRILINLIVAIILVASVLFGGLAMFSR